MDKIIGFGINEKAKPGKINATHDKMDLENGTGKYLGLIKIYDKHYVVTLTESGHNKGLIMVNEILFDSYMDGDISFYYCTHKSEESRRLEDELNNPTLLRLIKDGQSIYDMLSKIDTIKKSP